MADINALYSELQGYIHELEAKFVNGYIPADQTIAPSDYGHDVKAFCVLAHAAFEEFIEGVVITVLDNSVDKWIIERKADGVIIALVCWHGAELKIDNNENSEERKPFDYLRPLIEEAKGAFSNHVFLNHGVSILYLRSLLILSQ